MSKTIIVAVLVGVVILTECLFAWLLIPSTSDVEAWAEGKTAQTDDHGPEPKTGHSPHHLQAEVDLGKFNVVVHQPASQITLRVNFHLIGTVEEEHHEEFETLLGKHQHRLRDNVIFEIRNCQVEDLTDPGLALLKRRILAKSNDLLGKPMLRSIVFSDFAFIEQ
jgi:flagellar FliL protein